MSMIKRYLEKLQQEYAEHMFIKDGCPEEDAKNENWDSMVEMLYDGNYEAAWEEFQVFSDKNQPS